MYAGCIASSPCALPASIGTTAKYEALARTTATFVFDASLARASAAAVGRTAPPMPAKLDGSTLVLTGGPAIMVVYGSGDQTGNTLVIGVAKAPTVGSDGASVSEIQAYLLSQPSVSPALAAQIRAIGDPATTLPIPIPVGQAAAKNVSVHGVAGLFIGDSTGLGSAVLWQQNGLVYIVGGTLTEAETLAALGQKQRAIDTWRAVLANHSYARAKVQLAELYADQGHAAEAKAELAEVIADDAHIPKFQRKRERIWVNRAKALLKKMPA